MFTITAGLCHYLKKHVLPYNALLELRLFYGGVSLSVRFAVTPCGLNLNYS